MGELDEIEIQKGLLQIGKALQFLHESAKLVHSNLTPDAIVINAKVGHSLCIHPGPNTVLMGSYARMLTGRLEAFWLWPLDLSHITHGRNPKVGLSIVRQRSATSGPEGL